MPYLAALAAASALYYYLKTPPSSVTHTQAVAHSGGDMGDNPDLTGQDLARLYLDQLDSLRAFTLGSYGDTPGSYGGAGVSAAGVPVSSAITNGEISSPGLISSEPGNFINSGTSRPSSPTGGETSSSTLFSSGSTFLGTPGGGIVGVPMHGVSVQ